MATNKNQHFVPRCYLRPFTIDEDNKAINLYNIDRKKFIPKAPVKNQCSKDYFYGQDDQLEHAIQLVESGYAASLRNILNSNKKLSEENKEVLKIFWLFQYMRTEAAAERAVKMSESTRITAGIDEKDFHLEIKEAVQIAMKAFAKSMHIIDDLKFCLIRNKTKTPFITSDDPAVLSNKWHFEDKRTQMRSFGLSSAGAVAILPLSPKLLFLGYDGDVYNVSHNFNVVDVKNERDVAAFNEHQFLNCRANIFLQKSEHAEIINDAYMGVEKIRPQSRHLIHYAVLDHADENIKRYVTISATERDKHEEAILHTQVVHPQPRFWPSQIKNRTNGSVYSNDTGMGFRRYQGSFIHSQKSFHREKA